MATLILKKLKETPGTVVVGDEADDAAVKTLYINKKWFNKNVGADVSTVEVEITPKKGKSAKKKKDDEEDEGGDE